MSYTQGSLLNRRQQLNIRSGEAWVNAAQKRYGQNLDALGSTPTTVQAAASQPMMKLVSAVNTMPASALPGAGAGAGAAASTAGQSFRQRSPMLFWSLVLGGGVVGAVLLKKQMKRRR
jgi:hypothetical protein